MKEQELTAIFKRKTALRQEIAQQRAALTPEELLSRSREVMHNLEKMQAFQQAQTIFLYHSMPGEVETREIIARYHPYKTILLPMVTPRGLVLRHYIGDEALKTSAYGISEPVGDNFTNYDTIDFVVVPGVAFDRSLNRLGFGKAYYDNLLPKIKAVKVAICFDFQLFDSIPHTSSDVKMDQIVCQSQTIA